MSKTRRSFIQSTLAAVAAGFISMLPRRAQSATPDGAKGIIKHASDGEVYYLRGHDKAPVTIKVSKSVDEVQSISFCTELIEPQDGVPVHKHLYEDEIIFIHKGRGKFTLGDEVMDVREGSTVFVPKGVWHGLFNDGAEDIVMVFGYNPSGFEGYFRELGTPKGQPFQPKTMEEYKRISEKYGFVMKR